MHPYAAMENKLKFFSRSIELLQINSKFNVYQNYAYLRDNTHKRFRHQDAFRAYEFPVSLDICNANCTVGISVFCMNFVLIFVHRYLIGLNSKLAHIYRKLNFIQIRFNFFFFQFSLHIICRFVTFPVFKIRYNYVNCENRIL